MKEFDQEKDKLQNIVENNKKIESKLSPVYQLRKDNRNWRQFGILGYNKMI